MAWKLAQKLYPGSRIIQNWSNMNMILYYHRMNLRMRALKQATLILNSNSQSTIITVKQCTSVWSVTSDYGTHKSLETIYLTINWKYTMSKVPACFKKHTIASSPYGYTSETENLQVFTPFLWQFIQSTIFPYEP